MIYPVYQTAQKFQLGAPKKMRYIATLYRIFAPYIVSYTYPVMSSPTLRVNFF